MGRDHDRFAEPETMLHDSPLHDREVFHRALDPKIAELIDSKAGLAARALDGSDEELSDSTDLQLEALVALLTEALSD